MIYLPIVSGGAMEERAKGIDISGWNTVNDWPQIGTAGLSFAFIKATEGVGYKANYKAQWDGAGSIGLLRSNYGFLRYEAGTGAAQARYFMAHATKGELPPVVDFEDIRALNLPSVSGAMMFECLRSYCDEIRSGWGVDVIRYSGLWYTNMCAAESPAYDYKWVNDGPGWWAAYVKSPPVAPVAPASPPRPAGFGWKLWQYTSSGKIPGIVGPVDLNVYNGTVAELKAWAGVGPEKPALTLESLDARVTELEARIK